MTRYSTEALVSVAGEATSGIAALNVIQLEHAEAIIAAAEAVERPVILQISENAVKYHGGLVPIAAACIALADSAAVPVALHLDHATSTDLCRAAIDHGFDSVMIDASQMPWEENVRVTTEVTSWCHERGIWVEAELGEVGGKGAHVSGARTRPDEAQRFVELTGIDGLAIAIGSTHAMKERTASIDRSLLEEIRAHVDVPLVLHGSSGLPDAEIRAAIELGICKINIGTQLNIAMTNAVRNVLDADSKVVDPRRYLGHARSAIDQSVRDMLTLITKIALPL